MDERCVVEVDLGAVAHNVTVLMERARPAALCAVVKADGYGHGAVEVARVALQAGATSLAVACAEEGLRLRRAGVAAPILVLTEPPPGDVAAIVDAELSAAVWSVDTIEALAREARAQRRRASVHLKVDTGMRRAGCEMGDAVVLAKRAMRHAALSLDGLMTHLAVADEPERHETAIQLARFRSVIADLEAARIRPPLVHAANSAGLLCHPSAHHDLVRVGIALYGLPPAPSLADVAPLQPALSFRARVGSLRRVRAGEGVSYGLRWRAPHDTTVAALTAGYADGVRRALGLRGAPVLLGGRRRPMVGVVTMDQTLVDCGPTSDVAAGDEAVLIGRQGEASVHAQDWAHHLDTISYEVTTGIGARVRRVHRPPSDGPANTPADSCPQGRTAAPPPPARAPGPTPRP